MFDFLFKLVQKTASFAYNSFLYNIGSALATEGVISILKSVNDQLTENQTDQLRDMIYRMFILHRDGRNVRHMLSGVCALSLNISHTESEELVSSMLSIFDTDSDQDRGSRSCDGGLDLGDVSDDFDMDYSFVPSSSSESEIPSHDQGHPQTNNMNDDSDSTQEAPSTTSRLPNPRAILSKTFGIRSQVLADIPPVLYPALIRTLRDPERTTCVISLESLVEEDGVDDNDQPKFTVSPGTAVLFQRSRNASPNERHPKFHAYLFSKTALEEWFSSSNSPTNPLTRQSIDKATQYYTIS